MYALKKFYALQEVKRLKNETVPNSAGPVYMQNGLTLNLLILGHSNQWTNTC